MNTPWRALRLICMVLMACLGLILGVACISPPPPAPPPQELLNQAARKFDATRSFHFVIDVTGAPTYLDGAHTLALRHVEGDVARPDRVRANVKASFPGAFVQIQMVGIGNDQYATNPLNGQWQKIPPEWGFNPSRLFQSDIGLAAIMANAQNLTALPDETIDGQRHRHIAGQVAGDRVVPLTGGLVGGGTVQFDLWVGADDSIVRRIRLTEEAKATSADGTPMPAQWNMDLGKFDVPVTIVPPPL
jgi:hypothetical protein